MQNINMVYKGHLSEFHSALLTINEREFTFKIEIVTATITPYGVTPTMAQIIIRKENPRETIVGFCDLDYLVCGGGRTTNGVDLQWLINKAKSVQARLPITIQPTLLLQPWSLPDSEDEKDSDDDLLNDDLPDDLLEQLEQPPPQRGDIPEHLEEPPAQRGAVIELSEDGSDESDSDVEDEETNSRIPVDLEGADMESLSGQEEYQSSEDDAPETEKSTANDEENYKAQIANLEFMVAEFNSNRRERENYRLAVAQLEELREKVRSMRRISSSVESSPPSTPTTNKRKRKGDYITPPFTDRKKRARTKDNFQPKQYGAKSSPTRQLQQVASYSEDDPEEEDGVYEEDEVEKEDGHYQYGAKTTGPLSIPDADEEDEEDEEDSEEYHPPRLSHDNNNGNGHVSDDDDYNPVAGGDKAAPAPAPAPVQPQPQPQPQQSQRAGAYSEEEHNALTACMQNLRQDEARRGIPDKMKLKDTKLYARMEREMRERGYDRSANSCKNYWNRYGRSQSGFEERVGIIKNASLVTSAQK